VGLLRKLSVIGQREMRQVQLQMLKMPLVHGWGLMHDWGDRRWFNIVTIHARMVITRDDRPTRRRCGKGRVFWRGWRGEAVKELNKEMIVEGMSPGGLLLLC